MEKYYGPKPRIKKGCPTLKKIQQPSALPNPASKISRAPQNIEKPPEAVSGQNVTIHQNILGGKKFWKVVFKNSADNTKNFLTKNELNNCLGQRQ